MRQPSRAASLLVVAAMAAACGGGGTDPAPPPPPPPTLTVPVASVSVDPASVSLTPLQTQALTVILRGASNQILTGRPIAWSTDAQAVATVSSTGVVTAVGPGTATITATTEGRSGTAAITVIDGAQVGPAGGTLTLAGGKVRVVVPAGAVTAPVLITAVPRSSPLPGTPAGWRVAGQVYDLGPDGTTFALPVTVTLSYDRATLPVWAMTGDLGLLRLSGGQWHGLDDITVDVSAATISGRTSGFSGFGVGVKDPEVSLSPASASVNSTHRARTLAVVMAPRGQAMPLPAGAEPLRYRWRTTGQNGVLTGVTADQWTTVEQADYLATAPALAQMSGQIDVVSVDVLLNPESLTNPNAGPQRIVTVQAAIDADLEVTYDLTPESPVLDPGEVLPLKVLVRDKQGAELSWPAGHSVTWATSGLVGGIAPGPSPMHTASYTAWASFPSATPWVDDVTATVIETRTHTARVYNVFSGIASYQAQDRTITAVRGAPKVFLEIKPDYTVTLTPAAAEVTPGGQVVLSAQLAPGYHGPQSALRYRYTMTGSSGTLSVPTGVLTSAPQVTYTANANAQSGATIQVEVVTVVAGVEIRSLGTGQAQLSTPTPFVAWRLTSWSQTNTGNACTNIGDQTQNPGLWIIFAFPTATPGAAGIWPTPGVYLARQVPNGSVTWGTVPVPLAHTLNAAPNIEGVMSWTGDAQSGSVTGMATTIQANPNQNICLFTIDATKSGGQLSGTITGTYRPGSLLAFTATFTAVRVP